MKKPQHNPLIHLDYEIDKKRWKDIFYNNIQEYGQWHWSCPKDQNLYWYQLFIKDDHPLKKFTVDVERELGIYGMNNYPRFSYQFKHTKLDHHLDEDNMISININLFDETPIIHIDHKPYPYECALIDVGHFMHGVEPVPYDRLILKFCLRHPWEEVYERLDKFGLII